MLRISPFPSVLLVLVASAGVSLQAAESPPRKARLLDTSGVIHQCERPQYELDSCFDGRFSEFYYGQRRYVALEAQGMQIAVPIDYVMTITMNAADNPTTQVKYIWLDKEQTLVGKIVPGRFRWQSEFGDVQLPAGQLKELTFETPPAKRDAPHKKTHIDKRKGHQATVTLTDGTTAEFADVKCENGVWDPGWGTGYHEFTEFRMKHGESSVRIPFDRIRSITFGDNSSATVVTKGGKTLDGTLQIVAGFTGKTDKGSCFVFCRNLKSVEFADTESSQ